MVLSQATMSNETSRSVLTLILNIEHSDKLKLPFPSYSYMKQLYVHIIYGHFFHGTISVSQSPFIRHRFTFSVHIVFNILAYERIKPALKRSPSNTQKHASKTHFITQQKVERGNDTFVKPAARVALNIKRTPQKYKTVVNYE